MRKIITILFLFSITLIQAQENVFKIARNGTKIEMRKIYKENPEIINSKNKDGYTPFLLACYNGNVEVVEFLVTKVKNINGESKYGTPLMAAVYKRDEKVIDILLNHNVAVNISDSKGITALHYATMFNNTSIAKKLINAGAKFDIKDVNGKTAFDYIISHKNEEILTLIKK